MTNESLASTERTSNRAAPLIELDVVRAVDPISNGDISVPRGAVGTVVFVHEEDAAFEVEFAPPHQVVVLVHRSQICPL